MMEAGPVPHGKPRIRFSTSPLGVLAEVWFPDGRGGGAAMAPDRDAALRMAAEIVVAHGKGRANG